MLNLCTWLLRFCWSQHFFKENPEIYYTLAIFIANLRNDVETIIVSFFTSEWITFIFVKNLLISAKLKIFILHKPNRFWRSTRTSKFPNMTSWSIKWHNIFLLLLTDINLWLTFNGHTFSRTKVMQIYIWQVLDQRNAIFQKCSPWVWAYILGLGLPMTPIIFPKIWNGLMLKVRKLQGHNANT